MKTSLLLRLCLLLPAATAIAADPDLMEDASEEEIEETEEAARHGIAAIGSFEFGCAVEIFGLPRPEFGDSWYRFTTCAADRGPLRAMGGVTVENPTAFSYTWTEPNFLAGIFDAEGSYGETVRISNTDPEIIDWVASSLRVLGFSFVLEDPKRANGLRCVSLLGGLQAALRFFHTVDPAITRDVSRVFNFITGYAENAQNRQAFLGEGMDMLLKPFNLNELLRAVRLETTHASTRCCASRVDASRMPTVPLPVTA